MPPRPWTKERFLSYLPNTDNPNACWEWPGCRRNGYGRIGLNGKTRTAHRVAFEVFIGPIPEGHDVCHTCDNPPCCNPAHLFSGTTRENIMDMLAKGRRIMPHGSEHGRATLTEAQVLTIRAMHAEGIPQTEIARRIGTNTQRVYSIVHRRTWKHV